MGKRLVSGQGLLNVAVVGLEFGASFVPIYLEHPLVGEVGICDARSERLEEVGERFGIDRRYHEFDAILAEDRWDAVHIVTPVATHADFAVRALSSGKHCACAVPMATTDADIRRVLEAERSSNCRYMMMETMVYSRAYLYVKDLHEAGGLGALTFLRGAHLQDLEGYARYWQGYPPMHYVTHALAPLLDLASTRAESVSCLGSGHLPDHVRGDFDNSFPLETALFRLAGTDLAAEVTMAFFQTARPYVEGFSAYGERRSFEWQQGENELPRLYEFLPIEQGRRGRRVSTTLVDPPDKAELLPAEIRRFTRPTDYDPPGGRLGSVRLLPHHGSSHPHLVHEFVSAVSEDRACRVAGPVAARWTQPGVTAHQSALQRGSPLAVPDHEVH
jgi:predicted dehydrogenase